MVILKIGQMQSITAKYSNTKIYNFDVIWRDDYQLFLERKMNFFSQKMDRDSRWPFAHEVIGGING